MNRCRNCGRAQRSNARLCFRCNRDPEARAKHLSRAWEQEPTTAELDALIAEQRKCLPPWWNESGANND